MPYIWIPDGFTISDAEFAESKAAQENVYSVEGGRQAGRSYLDPLGHARWDTDYYTLRTQGYSHAAACQEVRCRIREAWSPSPLPAIEAHPPKPVVPIPPVPPPVVLPPVVVVPPGVQPVTDEEFHRAWLAILEKHGNPPTVNNPTLVATKADVEAIGCAWQHTSGGELRPRLFLPVPAGADIYGRAYDMGLYGEPWQWIKRY